MAESPTSEIRQVPPRETGQRPAVEFEAGYHVMTDEERALSLSKFQQGDLRAHIWNPQIGQRIRTYNGSVLAIDSQVPFRPPTHEDKEAAWRALPDRPSMLNKEGVVYVVRGDLFGIQPENDVEGGADSLATAAIATLVGSAIVHARSMLNGREKKCITYTRI